MALTNAEKQARWRERHISASGRCHPGRARAEGGAMKEPRPLIRAADRLPDLATRISHEHNAAVGTLKRGLQHALTAGHLLLEAKQYVSHGQWLPWLNEHCRVSERTAQVYMRLARRLPKNARPADLTITQALEMVVDAPGDLEIENAFPASQYPGHRRPPTVVSQCVDCGLGTIVALEFHYEVKRVIRDRVWPPLLPPWRKAEGQMVLCIGCLETRLGRTLMRTDFRTEQVDPAHMSDRLLSRLTAALPARSKRRPPSVLGQRSAPQ
jgi:Protein of unknown function (DUF3102)